MATLFDYLAWRGDLTFSEAPLNEVDSLIFSMLSYVDFSAVVSNTHSGKAIPLRVAANAFFAKQPEQDNISLGLLIPKEIVRLLRVAKETHRFRNVGVRAYVNLIDHQKEMQFSATTFLPDGIGAVIAYRGTDDTLVGWKEDFNMCFMPEVPAQTAAKDYLDEAAKHTDGRIWITGHSKGGNLAVWAAVHCDDAVKPRIEQVFCNDGPGFYEGMLDKPAYRKMRPLIRYFVPQGTVVGVLLEHTPTYTVVKSRHIGLWQHDGMSWEVMGNSLVHLEDVTGSSKRTDRRLREFLKKMNTEQRTQFVGALYQIMTANRSLTLTELVKRKRMKGTRKLALLDPQVRQAIRTLFTVLVESNRKNPTYKALP